MTKRIIDSGLCAALLLAWFCATGLASDPRLTPLVRAVKRAKASVVNIHSEKTSYSGDTLFSSGRGRKIKGMGSGIVIDERGYIVTNYHVVNGVDSLRITLEDGATYNAEIISHDRKQDLALIKINASKPLPVMPMGTSSDLMLGETVIAVGNAFGYEHTVTAGIVSSLSRDVEVNEKQSYKNLIQTDASINPGNSGGPLLNLEGEVVGINVAIRAGAQRIGFAIPIDDARRVIARLLNIERLSNTYHGLKCKDVKLGKTRKLVVDSALPESPAAAAGFRAGDIVTRAGTIDVIDRADFERALLGRPAGENINVVVRRDSKTQTLTLRLDKHPGAVALNSISGTVVRANNNPADGTLVSKLWRRLGIKLAQLSGSERILIGSRYRGGVRVTAVRQGSPADVTGIREGDILVGLHIWETISLDNVSYIIDHPQFATFGPLKFYIVRGSETLFGHMQPTILPK